MENYIINGALSSSGEISINDRGFLLGDGLFETILIIDGRPYLLDRHIERLDKGTRVVGINSPVDITIAEQSILKLASLNSVRNGVARLTITRGGGPRGYQSFGCDNPTWALSVRPYVKPPDSWYEDGIRLVESSYKRDSSSPLSGVKTTSAIDRVMMADYARKKGGDEALVLTVDNKISGCAAANLFWVKEGALYTPSTDCGIVEGITRLMVIALAEKAGIEICFADEMNAILKDVDEIFITNSLIGVVPVREILDNFKPNKTPGTITEQISALYKNVIHIF